MGKREGIQIVVVVEDQRLERFVRNTLHAFGFDKHKVRVLQDYPKSGAGSGKQYREIDWKQAGEKFKDEYNCSKRETVDTLGSLSKAYIETRRIGD